MSAEESTPPSVPPTHPLSTPSHAEEPLAKRPKPTPTASFDLSADKPSVDLSQIPAFNMTSTSAPAPPLLIKKLSPKGRAPTRGSAFAAGYDVYASEETVVPSKGKALVSTGIAMAIPGGCYGRVAPRSGLAVKSFIDTGAGVIDSDYRGELKILLFNHSDVDFKVTEGDRVAQLILERIYTPEVEVVEELEESVRGAGGFGSTGVGLVKTI